jgi:hypothetical protein
VAESHVRQLVAGALCFSRIGGFLEPVREFEKYHSPLLVGRDRVRQEIDDRTICAHVPSRRDAVELFGDLSRFCALPDCAALLDIWLWPKRTDGRGRSPTDRHLYFQPNQGLSGLFPPP